MKKRIAVLVRERQSEALRMAIGLTLADDEVTVFVLGRRLSGDTPNLGLNLEMLGELGVRIYSDNPEDSLAIMPREEIAGRLPEYDSVIPY